MGAVPPWHRVCEVILQICKHIQFCIVRLSCKHIANIKHIQFTVANLLPTYSFCKVWIQLSTYCQHILKSVDSASLHTDTPLPIVTMTPLCVKVTLVLVLVLVSLASSMPVTPGVAETARLAWNSWQEFERDNLPWLYRCEGPIGLFCPGPGPDVYDLIPDLPRFPGTIPPP